MRSTFRLPLTAAFFASALAGCAAPAGHRSGSPSEDFDASGEHTRTYLATTTQTCEAARRAGLSQGYALNGATSELVTGRKNFQPQNETHVEIEFRIVCAPAGSGGAGTIAFVSAVQERYALKKVNNSASVGVGVLGSVSLPFTSSDDAMVKVASETLSGRDFYARFFELVQRYMPPPEAVGAAASSAAVTSPVPN